MGHFWIHSTASFLLLFNLFVLHGHVILPLAFIVLIFPSIMAFTSIVSFVTEHQMAF